MNMNTRVMTTISRRNRYTAGEGNDSTSNDDDGEDDDDDDVDEDGEDEDGDVKMSIRFEGNQSHVSGYEWVDCRPKQLQSHQEDKKARSTKSTHSSVQAEQRNLSHDFRIAFLSLDAVKIFGNRNNTTSQDEEEARNQFVPWYLGTCDCATRWGIYHKYVYLGL